MVGDWLVIGDWLVVGGWLAIWGVDKIEERGIPDSMVQSAARFGAPRVMAIVVARLDTTGGNFSKPKTPRNGNKLHFPGATCIFSKFCERQYHRARNFASDAPKCRAFWGP